ncbi:MAG: hypothetical protein JSW58_12320 [Candidatus Latescibacterota bacterium]|nr:MAG: hypothetical protein JSW58_12320 [Candidatus Latescibacterota bacterium]
MNSRDPYDPQTAYRIAALINVSMVVSLFIYAGIVEFLNIGAQSFAPMTGLDIPRYVFLVGGLVFIPVARLVRANLLQRSPDEPLETLLVKLSRAAVVTGAICEVPALLGLVLFFIGGQRVDFYLLCAVSAGMFIVYFPRLSRWKDWLGRAYYQRHADVVGSG